MSYKERNKMLKELGYNSYDDYRASITWTRIKGKILGIDTKCAICDKPNCVTHHRSYSKEVLLGEDMTQLIPLCRECHKDVEFFKDGSKRMMDEVEARLVLLLENRPDKTKAKVVIGYTKPKYKKNKKKTPKKTLYRPDICFGRPLTDDEKNTI